MGGHKKSEAAPDAMRASRVRAPVITKVGRLSGLALIIILLEHVIPFTVPFRGSLRGRVGPAEDGRRWGEEEEEEERLYLHLESVWERGRGEEDEEESV
jgi:hypothetical protein